MPEIATETSQEKEQLRRARALIMSFFMTVKNGRVYEANNDSYRVMASRFYQQLIDYISDTDTCSIKVVKGRLFVDDHFICSDQDEKIGAEIVVERWSELGIGGIVFGDPISPEHIDTFVRLLWAFKSTSDTRYEEFLAALNDAGVETISILPRLYIGARHVLDEEGRQHIRRHARNTFFQAISTVKHIMSHAENQEKISVTRTRRVVHSIIDRISEDEAALIELASIKNYDEYTYAHCTNVCIYSLTLGFRLGLDRRELAELGFAALFHDIGKVKLPYDLINKPDKFDENDWVQMQKHPLFGAMTIGKTLKLDRHMSRAMAVAFEHHINPDHTGYPRLREPRPLNLYSRIVTIADSFDALSSGRIYIKDPIPPDEVLKKLMYQMHAKFDAVLLKLFVNIIGIFPVGSLVLLSNDNLAIVSKTNQDVLDRPCVRLIADKYGELAQPVDMDLAREEFGDIAIAKLIDESKYNIDLSKFILADQYSA